MSIGHWCRFFQYKLAFIFPVVHIVRLLCCWLYKYHLARSVLQSFTAASYLGLLAHILNSATGDFYFAWHHHKVLILIVHRLHIKCTLLFLVLRALVGYEQEKLLLIDLQNSLDNVIDLRLAEDVLIVFRDARFQRQVKQLLGDHTRVMEQAHIHNVVPFSTFYGFFAIYKNFSTLLKNDVSVHMFLWDCFLNVGNWVHDFNPQVECLKHASVHLDEMVIKLTFPLFKGIKQRLLTCGSELFLG